MNPYNAIVQELRTAILAEQQELNAARAAVAAWEGAQRLDTQNNASYETRANTARRLSEERARVQQSEQRLAALESDLAAAESNRDNWDRAYIEATSKGMTGEEAKNYADAKAERVRLTNKIITWALIALGIGVLVWGVAAVVRWRKNRK